MKRERTDLAKMITRARAMLSKHPDKKSSRSPNGEGLWRRPPAGKLTVLFPGRAAVSGNDARFSLFLPAGSRNAERIESPLFG